MKTLKKLTLLIGFAMFIAAPVMSIAQPTQFLSNASALECEQRLLGIPPWYRGLTEVTQNASGEEQCVIKTPGEIENFVTQIALNVIEIILVLVGYIAAFFILFGGFQFLTGGSNPSQIEKARRTMLNAVIGLAISLGAVGIVNLIFGILN